MKNTRILLVDDDHNVLSLLESALTKNGYLVFKSTSGEEASQILDKNEIHLVLLDIMLPGIDGLEMLRIIRNNPQHKHIPVIMLTCRTSEIDNVLGLELGADDYIGKPLRYYELMARIKAVLRRTAHQVTMYPKTITLGDLEIDLSSRTIRLNGQELNFSYTEFELTSLMAKKPGKVFTREEILNAIWSTDCYLESRTIDVHIRRIRKKFAEAAGSNIIIETVRNVGYRLKTY
ncbi:MAG: response regulator transcription factor [Desulfitobacteriia bacterium]